MQMKLYICTACFKTYILLYFPASTNSSRKFMLYCKRVFILCLNMGVFFTVLSLKPPLTLNCLGVVHCKLVKWLLLYPLYAQLYVTDYTFSENAFCSIQIRNNEENFVHIFAYIRITCKCLKVRQWKASIFQS